MEQRRVVDAFLDALRRGDFEGLVAVLDLDIVVRVDEAPAVRARRGRFRGARTWAKGAIAFLRQLPGTVQPMLVNGGVGLVWTPGGRVFRVLRFSFSDGKIATVDIIADPARLREFDLAAFD
jgi:hypothetical protein